MMARPVRMEPSQPANLAMYELDPAVFVVTGLQG